MYNSTHHHRRSIRLRGYNYSWAGMYFVTVCTHLKRCLLGQIVDGRAALSPSGKIVEECLLNVPERFSGVRIDTQMVMPNHVHAILVLQPFRSETPAPTLGSVVRHWKAASCRLIRSTSDPCFGWQRNYYERVLRDEEEVLRARRYILENPANWDHDQEHPQASRQGCRGAV